MIIALIDFNNSSDVRWDLGPRVIAGKSVREINDQITRLKEGSNYIFFFNSKHALPGSEELVRIAQSRGHLWHGGRAGNGEGFSFLSYIKPSWMLNLSPERNLEYVSWKISPQSAFIPVQMFDRYGLLHDGFSSVSAAFSDWGYTVINGGGIPVYKPELESFDQFSVFGTYDQIKFLQKFFPVFWIRWALWRAFINSDISFRTVLQYWITKSVLSKQVRVHSTDPAFSPPTKHIPAISVVIITLNRYEFLKRVIEQLSVQTIPVAEIIVVDASPLATRNTTWTEELTGSNVHLRVMYSDIIGQCTQRNLGIDSAVGELVYFCDDDMEQLQPDHLERHLKNMLSYRADVSCGLPDEVDVSPINRKNLKPCVSTVFPTNDSLVLKSMLYRAGLFDTKMDRGQNEDQDLGIRIFLSGGLMILDPSIQSLHLRAGSGGLRQHGARVVTAELSKKSFVRFRMLHHSELYSDLKYFSHKNVRELMIISLFATFRMNGSLLKRIFKFLIAIFYLPFNYRILRNRYRVANTLIGLK